MEKNHFAIDVPRTLIYQGATNLMTICYSHEGGREAAQIADDEGVWYL